MNVIHRQIVIALCCVGAVLFTGCAQLQAVVDPDHRREVPEQFSRVDQHSSFPAIRRINYEQVNLIEMIDPTGKAEDRYGNGWEKLDWGRKYDLVLAWFREDATKDFDFKRQHRNSVQDKILGVSESRCNVFKTYLRRQQTDVNFLLGSATTIAGVLGAVLQGVNTSRNLAGAAGIFSGLQAEYNQSYYSNLAAHVIVQGINLHRNRLMGELRERRQYLKIDEYSMEAAIKDAIHVDGTCSTVVGLIEAQEAIKEMHNPGLTMAANTIVRARAMQELNQSDLKTLESSGRLESLLKLLAPVASPLAASAGTSDPSKGDAAVMQARDAELRIAAIITQQAENIGRSFDRVRSKLSEAKKEGPLKGSEIKKEFHDSAEKNIFQQLTKPPGGTVGVLTDCVAKLASPAQSVAQLNAKLLLVANDASATIGARHEVEKAQSALRAAVARVENIVTAATDAITQAAGNALKTFENSDNLTSFSKNAVAVSSPISTANLACPQ